MSFLSWMLDYFQDSSSVYCSILWIVIPHENVCLLILCSYLQWTFWIEMYKLSIILVIILLMYPTFSGLSFISFSCLFYWACCSLRMFLFLSCSSKYFLMNNSIYSTFLENELISFKFQSFLSLVVINRNTFLILISTLCVDNLFQGIMICNLWMEL